jgi:hypothetical protein
MVVQLSVSRTRQTPFQQADAHRTKAATLSPLYFLLALVTDTKLSTRPYLNMKILSSPIPLVLSSTLTILGLCNIPIRFTAPSLSELRP